MRYFTRFRASALACCIAAVCSGCGTSPRVTFYTLAPMTAPASTPAASPCSIAVFPVTVPEFVDRPQLVRTNAGSQVDVYEFHHWAEPLKVAIPRLLAENLSLQLKSDRVSSYPQSAANFADYRIVTDFHHFDASEHSVTIDALWSIRGSDGTVLKSEHTRLQEIIAGRGQAELVAAYGRALTGLSRDIAGAVQPICSASR